MYGYGILCGISKVPFEIPHKISIHTLKGMYLIEVRKIWKKKKKKNS